MRITGVPTAFQEVATSGETIRATVRAISGYSQDPDETKCAEVLANSVIIPALAGPKVTTDGIVYFTKYLTVTGVNFDIDDQVTIEHNLTLSKIIAIIGTAYNPVDNIVYPIGCGSDVPTDGKMNLWIYRADAPYIRLRRLTGSEIAQAILGGYTLKFLISYLP